MGVRGTLLAALRRRPRAVRAAPTALALALATATAAGATACGGGGAKNNDTTGASGRHNATISVWTLENEPDRVRATKQDFAGFTKRTGIRIRLRALD
jgi:ABC-type glycerol-3-phosphate transport system substrate-binding protein